MLVKDDVVGIDIDMVGIDMETCFLENIIYILEKKLETISNEYKVCLLHL